MSYVIWLQEFDSGWRDYRELFLANRPRQYCYDFGESLYLNFTLRTLKFKVNKGYLYLNTNFVEIPINKINTFEVLSLG